MAFSKLDWLWNLRQLAKQHPTGRLNRRLRPAQQPSQRYRLPQLLLWWRGGNTGGIALDKYGNICFINGSSSNSWHVFSSDNEQTHSDLLCVYYNGSGITIRGDLYSHIAGGSGSENGWVGTSSHRWTGAYIRTVYTLGGGSYDEYDDLAIVTQKRWRHGNSGGHSL